MCPHAAPCMPGPLTVSHSHAPTLGRPLGNGQKSFGWGQGDKNVFKTALQCSVKVTELGQAPSDTCGKLVLLLPHRCRFLNAHFSCNAITYVRQALRAAACSSLARGCAHCRGVMLRRGMHEVHTAGSTRR